MTLLVLPDGIARCVYGEGIDLASVGDAAFTRASRVEPDAGGRWHAALSPVGGPALGPYTRRSEAVAAEVGWLERHWLVGEVGAPSIPPPFPP